MLLLDHATQIDDDAWECRACGAVLDFASMRKHVSRCTARAEQLAFAWEVEQLRFQWRHAERRP